MKNACAVVLMLLVALTPLSAMADTWGDEINDPTRFVVLPGYGGTAVQDQETGLIWEQSPDATVRNWFDAQKHCRKRNVGNRSGWRLPTAQELVSLIDHVGRFGLGDSLPDGHPFSNVQGNYWSASTSASAPALAYDFASSTPDPGATPPAKANTLGVWCVRGGQGVDPQ